MLRLTKTRVEVYNLSKADDKDAYEALLNDVEVSHIVKEEFTYSKRTEQPIITVWYEEYIK